MPRSVTSPRVAAASMKVPASMRSGIGRKRAPPQPLDALDPDPNGVPAPSMRAPIG
jgi:hypothetical protein